MSQAGLATSEEPVETLRQSGARVTVLDNLSRGHRETVPPEVPFYCGDIGDSKLVARVIEEQAIGACIHFAAFAYVGESVENPKLYVDNNIVQGLSFLNSLRDGGVREIVFSSSCTTYGEPRENPIGEDHPQQPTNPYGWSKLLFEQMLKSYSTAYGMRYVALRYFNAAGATPNHGEMHDPEPHLIPNVLRAAVENRPVRVFGSDYPTADGTAVRDYVHISDLASAHVLALRYLNQGGPSDAMNLGAGQGHSVMQVIESARGVTGRTVPFEMTPRRAGDPSHLVAKVGKALNVLGWEPAITDLDQIVRSAWEWRCLSRR